MKLDFDWVQGPVSTKFNFCPPENQGILATAAYDYTIKIWNLADTKAETHSLEGHEDQVIVADVQHDLSDYIDYISQTFIETLSVQSMTRNASSI